MYHGTPVQQPSSKYSIRAELFAKHVEYLKKEGWRTILFRELFTENEFFPKTVVLCFDDGYADNFENAFIPLADNNMKATWFITSGSIGDQARWDEGKYPETKMLDESQIISMAEQGMEIASHTHTHSDLSLLDYESQLEEMRSSKLALEELIQREVVSFAYPFGRYNEDSIRALHSSRFHYACTVRQGRFSPDAPPLLIPRVTIFRDDTPAFFARKLILAENNVSDRRIISSIFRRAKNRLLAH
jgi:peptidoglycan/xylan/chitin deacetylase (PgdA/CDA1 family)